jgi:PEP-CTERM motif
MPLLRCTLASGQGRSYRASQNLTGGKLRAWDVWVWNPAQWALAQASFNYLQKNHLMKRQKNCTTSPTTRSDAEKLALATGSLSALSLLSFGAQASIIYTVSPVTINLTHPIGLGSGVTWSVDGINPTFKLWNNPGAGSFFLNIASKGTLLGRGLVRQDTLSVKDKFVNLGSGFRVGPSLAAGYRFGGRTNYRSVLTRTTKNNNIGMGNYAVKFTSGVNGFFGFRFTDAGLTNQFYGWAELNLDTTSPGTMTINRWAYNDAAGQSIKVGQTTNDNPVPEPGTLSLTLLGLGAGGVRAWRRRKLASAA